MLNIQVLLIWFTICGGLQLSAADTPFPLIKHRDKTLLTKDKSPYVSASNIHVPRGSQLDIEAGVVVKFNSGTGINIYGSINVSGNENNGVLFTLGDLQANGNKTDRHIRLVGGEREDQGTIVILQADGKEHGICDGRLGELEYQKQWADSIVKTVCNELGYVPSKTAKLIRGENPGQLLNENRWSCPTGAHSVQDCLTECCWACDDRYHVLGVDCSSVVAGHHWGGLHFSQQSDPSKSSLSYLTVNKAGVRINKQGEAELVPAVKSIGGTPITKNVIVTNSAHNGVMFSEVTKQHHIKELDVKQSRNHGLYVTSYVDEMDVSQVNSEDNLGAGILIERLPISSTMNHQWVDFCELTCIRCIHEASDFPLYYNWEKEETTPEQTCQTTFSTIEGHVLAFKVINASDNIHISLRDGANSDSPIIWSAQVETGQWANPPPAIVTSTNTITIKMMSTFYGYHEFVKFVLSSGPPESFGIHIKNIKSNNNGDSGLKLEHIQMPLQISNVFISNNTDGISLSNCSTYADLRDINSQFNRGFGIAIDDTDGKVNIESSELAYNTIHGISTNYGRKCSSGSVRERYALHLSVHNVIMSNNTGCGFYLNTNCRYNTTLTDNVITYNQMKAVHVNHLYPHDNRLHYFRLLTSTIANNMFGVHIQTISSLLLQIHNNMFSENQGTALSIETSGDYYFERRTAIFVTLNQFVRNRVIIGSVLSVSISYSTAYGRVENFTIINNLFKDNFVDTQPRNYIYSLKDLSAVVYLHTRDFVNLRQNVFANPESLLDLATGDRDPNNIVDARMCYWGTNDVDTISERIFSYEDSYLISRVLFHPFLNAEGTTNFTVEFPSRPNFKQNNYIGGVLYSNYVLSNTNNTYTVTKDIIVHNNATLTIEKGVKLQFRPGTSILVYGQINIIGDREQYVKLTADQTANNDHVRLINGKYPWEGVAQVKVNNQWFSLCGHNGRGPDINTRNFLCYSANFQDSTGFLYVNNKFTEGVLGPVNCDRNRFSSCEFSARDECFANEVLFLQCTPNYWSGIHLTVHAKPSVINYVDFTYTGYYFNTKSSQAAIEVDFNQHKLQNIVISKTFDDEDNIGIIIRKHDVTNSNNISGIQIKKQRGSGFISYDSRLTLTDAVIENVGVNSHYGIYIGSSMVEQRTFNHSLVKSICFTPEYDIDSNEQLFIRVHDVIIRHWQSCGVLFRAAEGRRIVIQVIAGIVGVDRSCGEQTLMFIDGSDSEVQKQGLGVQPSRDGHVWLSTTNVVQLKMNRMYHYMDQCMDITLSVKTFTGNPVLTTGSNLKGVHVKNFQQGIHLHEVQTHSIMDNITCTGAYSTGIVIYDGKSSVQLSDCVVGSSGHGGFLSRYYSGNVSISRCHFENNNENGAIWIWNANYPGENLNLITENCSFVNNDKAIEITKSSNHYRRYRNMWLITVSGNRFYDNREVLHVKLTSDNHLGSHRLIFKRNILENNVKGLIYAGHMYRNLYAWNIFNNTFRNFSDIVLEVRGSGGINNNVFESNSNPDSNIIYIEAVNYRFYFKGNKFLHNFNSRHIAHIFSIAYDVSISGNQFENNIVDDAVLFIDSWLANRFDLIPQFSWNKFLGNKPIDKCRETTAFLLKGFRKFDCNYNTFINPLLSSEMSVSQATSNSSSGLQMTKNYWGNRHKENILSRLSDGRTHHARTKIQIDPFYQDINMTHLSNNSFVSNIVKPDNILKGLISQNTTLSTSNPIYDILGDLGVPAGVTLTLPAGIILLLQPDSSIHVFGSINIEGSLYRPVVIQRGPYHHNSDCFSRVRLVDRPKAHEGRLEIYEDGMWKSVCRRRWTYNNAKVVCRLLGYGSLVSHYYNAGQIEGFEPMPTSRQTFQCSGKETSLRLCRHKFLSQDCNNLDPVGIMCGLKLPKPGIFLSSPIGEMPSLLQNVYFGNISTLQISGTPPIVENLTIWDSDAGFTYLGTGVANEKDITLKNVEILRSAKNGISLYDITSNVTIDHTVVSDVQGNGIYFSPSYDDQHIHAINGMKSTFHFCDSETVLNVLHGEEFKYFNNDGYDYVGCKRLFRTLPGYSVRLQLKAYTDSYEWQPIAAIYDGSAVDDNRKLLQFSTIKDDRQAQVADVQSVGNEMTIWVYSEEKGITFASVTSVPAKDNDCSFESGMCGWHNADDIYAVERGMWFLYSTNSRTYPAFKGLERDVNFPAGTDGHYMVVGETSSTCNYNDARFRRSETAILESPVYKKDNNLCALTFYHYRSIAHYYRAEHLTLYMKTDDSLIKLWRETSYESYDKWKKTTVLLDTKTLPNTFVLVFFAEFMMECPNSVGIDAIKFETCLEEKLVSTIRVMNSAFQYIPQLPIYMRNNDYQKHNIIWIEKVSILDTGLDADKDSASITIDMKSAYVLIRNIFLSRIHNKAISVEFDSSNRKRISEVSISQNSIQLSSLGGAIYVNNKGVNDASVWITGNNIMHNSAFDRDSIVEIVNTSLIMHSNLLYNNTGRYILELGNSQFTNRLHQLIENNTFWLNAAQLAASQYTVSMNATRVDFHGNVLNNPANLFEISTRSGLDKTNVRLQCQKNWWGSGRLETAKRRIRDGRNTRDLPYIQYIPVLETPPSFIGMSSSCPLGWRQHRSNCYFFNGGAVTFAYALIVCKQSGAVLMMRDSMEIDYIKEVTQYRDVDGIMKHSSIWVDNANGLYSAFCHTYQYNTAGDANIKGAPCNQLNPFICQKLTVVLCKNGCFQHGVCFGKTCLCDKGWDKEDCSVFHCRDVNNCSGNGICAGANYCQCKPGWMGRACSVSYCARFDKCRTCTRKTGCGWCDSTRQCLPGDRKGTTIESCPDWFYYKCMTLEQSTGCTSQINELECNSRYCNLNNSLTDKGYCQRCNDIQNCFSLKGDNHCYTWDEGKCPKGSPIPNYDDKHRIHNTVFKENVKAVNTDILLYFCPYKLSKDPSDNRHLFITNKQKLPFKTGDIITSAQSDGIMHKVQYMMVVDELHYILGSPVGLRDLVQYADFSQAVDMEELMHPLTKEQDVDQELLVKITENKINGGYNIHVIDGNVLTKVYKCTGHLYEIEGEIIGVSYYLVIPESQLPKNLAIGDIIAADKTSGFLESVIGLINSKSGIYLQTNLTHCDPESVKDIEIECNLGKPSMNCYGGNGYPGLLHYDYLAFSEAILGKTIIGRNSKPVIAKVLNIITANGYVYIEVVDIDYEDDGVLVVTSNPALLTSDRRRTRRSPTSFVRDVAKTYTYEVGIGNSLTLRPSGSIKATFDPTVEVDWKWDKMEVDWDIGAQFTGQINVGINAALKFKGDVSDKGGPTELFQKTLPAFYIPVGEPPTPVAGIAEFRLEFSWKLAANGEGIFNASGHAEGNTMAGFAMAGLPKPPNKFDGISDGSVNATLRDSDVSIEVTVKPQLIVRWPAVLTTMVPYTDTAPKSVADVIAVPLPKKSSIGRGHSSKFLPFMQVIFGAPFEMHASAGTCHYACPDVYKPMKTSVTSRVGKLEVTMTGLNMVINESYKHESLTYKLEECVSQGYDCCTCDSSNEPGKIDPVSRECLCACCCDTLPVITYQECILKGFKDLNGECSCNECPDRSLQNIWSDIKCPCTCSDGKEREMNEDGTCDCGCTCQDGSQDQLDEDGNCPCECQCKNCETSQKGPAGCQCLKDICPVCEDGAEPEWINCECRCPEPACGIPPLCVHGRRGRNCDQPDCLPCHECSGNGECNSYPGQCRSSCQCTAQWEGVCCERRRPRRAYGDPHIETLDGVWFDYFGIGQFWDCKSEANDFGFQVRYFYFKQTSFTGAVAVKVGESVITITTPSPAAMEDKPVIRKNGEVMTTDKASKSTYHDKVMVNIKPNYKSEDGGDDMEVLMISFTYKSGASLTVDVRFSPVMKRQYMNIMYTLTKDFKYDTSGLCGYMDDDVSNDLKGPDGTVFDNTDQFVASWQIHDMVRDDGGTRGSWSWTKSNFHKDDFMDLSYTDPSYQPSYNISGFTPRQIQLATQICTSLGVTADLVDGCIFDVVITNDTSLAEQETLKIGCPMQCSGKGRCKDGICQCLDGWSGVDCSSGACGRCYYGTCEAGFCACNVGWDGPQCNVKATCDGVNKCTDTDHGVCDKMDKCLCRDGYTGTDCSLTATCYNVNNCSDQGVCIDFDKCRCDYGWTGSRCNMYSCEALDYCSKHGQCAGYDVCVCNTGWKGPSCNTPQCTQVNKCSGNGDCILPNNCTCYEGYHGDDCSQRILCPALDNCNNNGLCVVDTNSTDIVCRCFNDFLGATCNTTQCPLLQDCFDHGTCIEPNVCECNHGYGGPDCSQFTCDDLNRCSGHGKCIGLSQCQCDYGWKKEDCSEADCSRVYHCSSQGICITPDKCDCFDGYQGDYCRDRADYNYDTPTFDQPLYTASVTESTNDIPLLLLTVAAKDSDRGESGEIRYSFDPTGLPININKHLSIDSITGDIVLINSISSVHLNNNIMNITIEASDRGMPSKTATAIFSLHIIEVNDHCPVITYPPVNQVVYVTLTTALNTTVLIVNAYDEDTGEHGRLTYRLSSKTDVPFFGIDIKTGRLYTTIKNGSIPIGEYPVSVTVMDSSVNPCAIESTFLVFVLEGKYIPKEPIISTTTLTPVSHSRTTSVISDNDNNGVDDDTVFELDTPKIEVYTRHANGDSVSESPVGYSPNYRNSNVELIVVRKDYTAIITLSIMLTLVVIVSTVALIILVRKLRSKG